MKVGRFARKLTAMLAASTFLLATEGSAWAQHSGGHAGRAAAPAGAVRGGAVGGPRGENVGRGGPGFRGPGFRGGPGGWRGYGWRRAPGWGWWWGWGWPLGVYLSVLPWYYSTFWWDGIPYYYANGAYYLWNGNVGQYEQVQPPPEVAQQAGAPPAQAPQAPDDELFAYPQNGQSPEQQAKDKTECRAWASSQVAGGNAAPNGPPGSSPGASPGNGAAAGSPATAAPATVAQRQDYLRAEAACLGGRGYSVE